MRGQRILDLVSNLTKKIPLPVLVASAGIFFVALVGLVVWQIYRKPPEKQIKWAVLYTDLSPADFSAIIDELEREGVPYRISDTTDTIFVPEELVAVVRNMLARKGLPEARVGLEIFEKPKFGLTEFMQKVNYQRAIQNELERTIMKINCVENARVHITIPQPRLFVDVEKKATASVMLWLTPGCTLPRGAVQGIVHLVSSAVEGLDPENVTVIDQRGRILNRKLTEEEEVLTATEKQHEIEREFETRLEEKLTRLLEKSVGRGKVAVKVDAVLDFNRVRRVSERYNPYETAVRSEHLIRERFKGIGAVPVGPPGVRRNVPPSLAIEPLPGTSKYERDETIRNYEISKVVEEVIEEVGDIKRLSVAVMVDGQYEVEWRNGKPFVRFIPLDDETLEKIKSFVIAAVGIQPARGDHVSVVSVPFEASVRYAEKLAMFKAKLDVEERTSMYQWLAIAAIGFFVSLYFIVKRILERRLPEEVEVVLPKAVKEDVPVYVPVAPPPPPVEEKVKEEEKKEEEEKEKEEEVVELSVPVEKASVKVEPVSEEDIPPVEREEERREEEEKKEEEEEKKEEIKIEEVKEEKKKPRRVRVDFPPPPPEFDEHIPPTLQFMPEIKVVKKRVERVVEKRVEKVPVEVPVPAVEEKPPEEKVEAPPPPPEEKPPEEKPAPPPEEKPPEVEVPEIKEEVEIPPAPEVKPEEIEVPEIEIAPPPPEMESPIDMAINVIEENPDLAAEIIKQWLMEK